MMNLSDEEISWMFGVFGQVDFLASYTSDDLEELIGKMERKIFSPGTVIIRQGEPGEFFFVIRRGQVLVTVNRSDKEKVVASLDEGDYFGEMSLLTGEACTATVSTVKEAEVFLLYPEALHMILMRNPALVKYMSSTISQRRTELHEVLGEPLPEGDDLLKKMRVFFNIKEK